MVQGVMCGGTFITKRVLFFAASISLVVLLTGFISMIVAPFIFSAGLFVSGEVLLGLGVVLLVVLLGVLLYQMTDSAQPSTVQQPNGRHGIPNMSPGQDVAHPLPAAHYPQANMVNTQQYPAFPMHQMPMSPGQQMTALTAPSGNPQQFPPVAVPQTHFSHPK